MRQNARSWKAEFLCDPGCWVAPLGSFLNVSLHKGPSLGQACS